ncbi:predicted protein [Chaetoceros tenuissimus]|uniref:Uncharacterized protein n=1 Tax=Chaetoceros tenuissimus TaxID=426638 RepID=A0AAD3HAE4_9STRA|nr:predicted protein [Chaetoceros tenuissimus]
MLVQKEYFAKGKGNDTFIYKCPPSEYIQQVDVQTLQQVKGGKIDVIPQFDGEVKTLEEATHYSDETVMFTNLPLDKVKSKVIPSHKCTSVLVKYSGEKRSSYAKVIITVFCQKSKDGILSDDAVVPPTPDTIAIDVSTPLSGLSSILPTKDATSQHESENESSQDENEPEIPTIKRETDSNIFQSPSTPPPTEAVDETPSSSKPEFVIAEGTWVWPVAAFIVLFQILGGSYVQYPKDRFLSMGFINFDFIFAWIILLVSLSYFSKMRKPNQDFSEYFPSFSFSGNKSGYFLWQVPEKGQTILSHEFEETPDIYLCTLKRKSYRSEDVPDEVEDIDRSRLAPDLDTLVIHYEPGDADCDDVNFARKSKAQGKVKIVCSKKSSQREDIGVM